MRERRRQITLAAALVCSLVALGAAAGAARADQPVAAIKSDTHRLAHDVGREARVVGRQVRSDAHQLNRRLLVARERASVQLHQLRHRIQRWWSRVQSG